MRWVTRAGMHVDRVASAWLIRRYIDRDAAFDFVADPDTLPPGATPFDIASYPFSHHDGLCTFEVLLRQHRLSDPALVRLGQIVHEADLEDERYDAPEAAGVDAIVRGLGRLHDDASLLVITDAFFDGLLAHLRAE